MSDERPPGFSPTLVLSRADVRRFLDLDSCIAAVERALVEHAHGRSLPPGLLAMPARDGVFHVKTAGLWMERGWAAVKVNGNFPRNRETLGLPNIQGVIVLCDARHGTPLALLDSIEITILRTGAATAVAAGRLARAGARSAGILGCGSQGQVQLASLARARPLARARVYDIDRERSLAGLTPILLGVAGGLVAATVVVGVVEWKLRTRREAPLALRPGPSGAGLAIGGGF